MIYISSLGDLPEHAAAVRPRRLISLLGNTPFPDTPPSVAPEHHLKLKVDDISVETADRILPGADHLQRLIDFGNEWNGDGTLMVHCYAGVSRSTAAALILTSLLNPGHEHRLARTLRERAPHAHPNARMIALADSLLSAEGRLVEAVRAIGAGLYDGWAALVAMPSRLDHEVQGGGS